MQLCKETMIISAAKHNNLKKSLKKFYFFQHIPTLYVFFVLDNCNGNACNRNGILRKGQHLQSENGISKLILNKTGQLEIWCKAEKIWSANKADNNVDFLYFSINGTIYINGKDNRSRWDIKTWYGKAELLLLRNDGNRVVYDECRSIIWESRTHEQCDKMEGMHSPICMQE